MGAPGSKPNPPFDVLLWCAEGFGTGRLRPMPGTWGSLAGFGWYLLLLVPANPWVWGIGSMAGIAASIFLSSYAEHRLKRRDPSSVVIDEICAVPICFLGWLLMGSWDLGRWPGPSWFFDEDRWLGMLGVLLLFRFFDIGKIWPIGISQGLPGGWGVTTDDLLAALYVNLVVLLVLLL